MVAGNAEKAERARYLKLFNANTGERQGTVEERRTTPVFSWSVKQQALDVSSATAANNDSSANEIFPQYGLLGFKISDNPKADENNEPIFMNTNAPTSAFLCGSQGSGKSYTLSCMLENCLLRSPDIGKLLAPLGGVVFHYDVNSSGVVAEAASICSSGVKVRVLVSRSNFAVLQKAYNAIPGAKENLTVAPLALESHHLSVERMHKLMASSEQQNSVPLYMEVIQRTPREMAIKSGGSKAFSYDRFMVKLRSDKFIPAQETTMNMRLNLLESFMNRTGTRSAHDIFAVEPGTLTIVDLSDHFLDSATACVLFDMCLGLFIEGRPKAGLVVALDEAHKFMNSSFAAENFTNRLLTTIREQRHNATRVIIATQEPTISDKLLDLCSVTIIHRFNSPAWFSTVKGHLAGASSITNTEQTSQVIFEKITGLNVGESLLFAPTGMLTVKDGLPQKLGAGYLKMKTRLRPGVDAGLSVLATADIDDDGEAGVVEIFGGMTVG